MTRSLDTNNPITDPILLYYLESYGLNPRDLENKKILDVGSATGDFSKALASLGIQVTSIDNNVDNNSEEYPTGFVQANYANMPFPDNYFDEVFATASILNRQDLIAFLKEAMRVVSKNGTIRFGPQQNFFELDSEERARFTKLQEKISLGEYNEMGKNEYLRLFNLNLVSLLFTIDKIMVHVLMARRSFTPDFMLTHNINEWPERNKEFQNPEDKEFIDQLDDMLIKLFQDNYDTLHNFFPNGISPLNFHEQINRVVYNTLERELKLRIEMRTVVSDSELFKDYYYSLRP